MDRDNIIVKISELEKQLAYFKSTQLVASKELLLHRYSGTWSHNGQSDKFIVFKPTKENDKALVQFAYESDNGMSYIYGKLTKPLDVYYADLSDISVATGTLWYVVSNVLGTVSITTTKPT